MKNDYEDLSCKKLSIVNYLLIDYLKRYVEDLVLRRFKDKENLKDEINKDLKDYGVFVGGIEDKSYYDDDFEDYELLLILSSENADLLDVTIYYGNTRIGEHVILETGSEEM